MYLGERWNAQVDGPQVEACCSFSNSLLSPLHFRSSRRRPRGSHRSPPTWVQLVRVIRIELSIRQSTEHNCWPEILSERWSVQLDRLRVTPPPYGTLDSGPSARCYSHRPDPQRIPHLVSPETAVAICISHHSPLSPEVNSNRTLRVLWRVRLCWQFPQWVDFGSGKFAILERSALHSHLVSPRPWTLPRTVAPSHLVN